MLKTEPDEDSPENIIIDLVNSKWKRGEKTGELNTENLYKLLFASERVGSLEFHAKFICDYFMKVFEALKKGDFLPTGDYHHAYRERRVPRWGYGTLDEIVFDKGWGDGIFEPYDNDWAMCTEFRYYHCLNMGFNYSWLLMAWFGVWVVYLLRHAAPAGQKLFTPRKVFIYAGVIGLLILGGFQGMEFLRKLFTHPYIHWIRFDGLWPAIFVFACLASSLFLAIRGSKLGCESEQNSSD